MTIPESAGAASLTHTAGPRAASSGGSWLCARAPHLQLPKVRAEAGLRLNLSGREVKHGARAFDAHEQVYVAQVRECQFAVNEVGPDSSHGTVDAQAEERRHQAIALLSALPLTDFVHNSIRCLEDVDGRVRVEHPNEREQGSCTR